jgi:hypothetical protein
MLFNTILTIEMMNIVVLSSRVFFDFRQCTPNVMLDPRGLGDVREEFAFLYFFDVLHLLNSMGKVICKSEESVCTLQCSFERCLRGKVTFLEDNVGTILKEFFGCWLARVASQCADLTIRYRIELLERSNLVMRTASEGFQNRSTLISCTLIDAIALRNTGRASYSDDTFCHFQSLNWRC